MQALSVEEAQSRRMEVSKLGIGPSLRFSDTHGCGVLYPFSRMVNGHMCILISYQMYDEFEGTCVVSFYINYARELAS
jgi:hypothetical protein